MSDSLQPHGLQHVRLPCPSSSPRVCSNSCPLSWWCYPTISSSVTSFSSCPKSFPASGSFPMSQLFASSYQVLKLQLQYLNFQSIFRTDSFRIYWFDFLAVQGTLKRLLQHHSSKASILRRSAFFMVQLSYSTWLMEKPELWLEGSLLAKWCLCFLICWLTEQRIAFF